MYWFPISPCELSGLAATTLSNSSIFTKCQKCRRRANSASSKNQSFFGHLKINQDIAMKLKLYEVQSLQILEYETRLLMSQVLIECIKFELCRWILLLVWKFVLYGEIYMSLLSHILLQATFRSLPLTRRSIWTWGCRNMSGSCQLLRRLPTPPTLRIAWTGESKGRISPTPHPSA